MPASVDVLALERIAARAWRATEEEGLGGWRLNASSGFSGRINACWLLESPGLPVEAAVDAVEAWYGARGLPPQFKIVEAASRPEGLGDHLRKRGYRDHTPTLMMVGPAAGTRDPAVRLVGTVDEAFARVFAAAGNSDPADVRERLDALGRMPEPRAFAAIDEAGEVAAIGACAVEGAWAGVFGMRTAERHRRKGLARRIFSALMDVAREHGARRAYLQVEAVNAPAIALYAEAGFETAYAYRYWTRP